jgi:hypothetical protein
MKNKSKVLKVLSTVAFCTMCLGSVSNQTFAATNDTDEGTAVAAYYYVNGEKIEIPKEDIPELLDTDSVYTLPYDPATPTDESTSGLPTRNANVHTPLTATTQPKGAIPNANACVGGYEYDGRLVSGAYETATSGARFANKTSSNIVRVSTISSNKSIGGEVSASGGFDWGPVEAEVGFKINGSVTWTVAQSDSVTIKPNKMGWEDYGSYKEKWTGTYYYLTSSCTQTGKVTVTPKGPKYKLDVARESAIPPGV